MKYRQTKVPLVIIMSKFTQEAINLLALAIKALVQ